MLGLSFILLTVVFRSIVVPAKAIVMNLLSVGAAYGLIVLIFQKGGPSFAHSIADALNFIQVDAIEAWLPLFLFSILFGLSMDYQVFLISRIREEYDKTRGQLRGGRVRSADHRWDHHRRRDDHGGRVRRLRERADRRAPADGLRPRGRGLPGRDDRSVDPGARRR